MLDVVANEGWLVSALSICNLVQMIVQARWIHDSSLLTLPHVEQKNLYMFRYVTHVHLKASVNRNRKQEKTTSEFSGLI